MVPRDYVRYESWRRDGWRIESILPGKLGGYEGETFGIFLPINIHGLIKNYQFSFTVEKDLVATAQRIKDKAITSDDLAKSRISKTEFGDKWLSKSTRQGMRPIDVLRRLLLHRAVPGLCLIALSFGIWLIAQSYFETVSWLPLERPFRVQGNAEFREPFYVNLSQRFFVELAVNKAAPSDEGEELSLRHCR